jgi:hypothetical protein
MLLVVLAGGAVQILVVWALFVWARWLSRLDGAPRSIRHLPWAMVAIWTAGGAGTIYGLTRAFGAVGTGSAEDKARRLAEGIRDAMLATACAALLVLLCVLLLLALTWRYRWAAKRETVRVEGDPPYR